ncbi:small ribosomal subunit Rsm22 family protein [Gaiella sp.]|uniref:small ribosomal subunit Rsm22 family protein n=1 Tax=Gaiella sp. TaxID=2663207 RepID=UPI0039831F06
MTLPNALQTGIEELVHRISPKELERSARALSDAYRAGGSSAERAARTPVDIAAYLATRAPATFAAAADVFKRIRELRPDWSPTSMLDLGAGPGIASWAAAETWRQIATVTLVEAEVEMARAGRTLARTGSEALQEASWIVSDAGAPGNNADLVVVSYLIGELQPVALDQLVREAWTRTTDTLVIIEPGTTAGYRRTLAARDSVVAAGGSTLAPCPHDAPCPLPADDWCHFSVRLPRSRTHRLAKDAERGFEDEKFSYAVLCREPHERAAARVLRRPDLRPGHVVLDLCTRSGLEGRTVSRKDGDAYRLARKSAWGDTVPGA